MIITDMPVFVRITLHDVDMTNFTQKPSSCQLSGREVHVNDFASFNGKEFTVFDVEFIFAN